MNGGSEASVLMPDVVSVECCGRFEKDKKSYGSRSMWDDIVGRNTTVKRVRTHEDYSFQPVNVIKHPTTIIFAVTKSILLFAQLPSIKII